MTDPTQFTDPAIAAEQPPKKRRSPGPRKPKTDPAQAAAPFLDGTVDLSPAQVSKLWHAVTGGSLNLTVINTGVGMQIACRVSLSSFHKALPVLLDSLKAGD